MRKDNQPSSVKFDFCNLSHFLHHHRLCPASWLVSKDFHKVLLRSTITFKFRRDEVGSLYKFSAHFLPWSLWMAICGWLSIWISLRILDDVLTQFRKSQQIDFWACKSALTGRRPKPIIGRSDIVWNLMICNLTSKSITHWGWLFFSLKTWRKYKCRTIRVIEIDDRSNGRSEHEAPGEATIVSIRWWRFSCEK